MRHYRQWVFPLSMILLAGCSSSGEVIRYPGPEGGGQAQIQAAAQASPVVQGQGEQDGMEPDARAEAERLAREEAERLAREEAAREAGLARAAAAAREAEESARQAEAARRAEATRREEAARQEQARREQAAREARERAERELAGQRARVDGLRERIAANEASTRTLDDANVALRQALTAAEELVQALTAEQNKYSSTDPTTGATMQPLDKTGIEEMQRELGRLKIQAETLMGQVAQ